MQPALNSRGHICTPRFRLCFGQDVVVNKRISEIVDLKGKAKLARRVTDHERWECCRIAPRLNCEEVDDRYAFSHGPS